jgi:peptide/nickel transport system permease protein
VEDSDVAYILRRLLIAIPVILIVSFVVFGMVFLSGDPAVLMMPPEATAEDVAAFRAAYGFDDPFLVQYGRFLSGAVQGNLGASIRYKQPVLDLVMERMPATLQLSVTSIVLAVFISLPLGTIAALRRNSIVDYLASVTAVIGQSMPNYWLGFLLVMVFAVRLHWLPTSGGPGLRYVILPAVTIAVGVTALVTRMTRSSVLEVIREDYVRTARSKGMREIVVITRHVLRNALLPVITVIALQFGYILGGAVVVETVFAWPGLGLLAVQAINNRDYPLVQAIVLVLAIAFVLINLTVDIIYHFLDPRVKTSAAT